MEYVRYIKTSGGAAASSSQPQNRRGKDPETPTRNPAASSSRQQGQKTSSSNPPGLLNIFNSKSKEKERERGREPGPPLPSSQQLHSRSSSRLPPPSSQQLQSRSPSRSAEARGTGEHHRKLTPPRPEGQGSRSSSPYLMAPAEIVAGGASRRETTPPGAAQQPTGPRGPETGFLKMRCFGPYPIDEYQYMRQLCRNIVGLTLEAIDG